MNDDYKQLIDMALDAKDFKWAKELVEKSKEKPIEKTDAEMYFDIMDKSEIINKIHSLMHEISERYSYFNKLYKEYYKKKISEKELRNRIHNKLITYSFQELEEIHYMHKMFSNSNCEWSEYKVGEIIHEEFLKIKYPEGHDIGEDVKKILGQILDDSLKDEDGNE